jgi:hypothetical protein
MVKQCGERRKAKKKRNLTFETNIRGVGVGVQQELRQEIHRRTKQAQKTKYRGCLLGREALVSSSPPVDYVGVLYGSCI